MRIVGVPGPMRGPRLAMRFEPSRIENQLDSAAAFGVIPVHHHAAHGFGDGGFTDIGHIHGIGDPRLLPEPIQSGLLYRIEIQLLLTDRAHIERDLVIGDRVDEVGRLEVLSKNSVEAVYHGLGVPVVGGDIVVLGIPDGMGGAVIGGQEDRVLPLAYLFVEIGKEGSEVLVQPEMIRPPLTTGCSP